jgi:putative N6-adenine-specific DNA methylase
MAKTFGIIAKTLYGLEDVLARELISLGADGVQIGRRMVSFEGDLAMLYKTNIHCRTALRILKPIREFKAKDADELYLQVKRVDWDVFLSPKTTFAIDAVVNSETFTHSKFVTYRAKDAIADYFTERGEERPSVSVSNPDLRLHLHISHNDCSISIDSSGESLHKRGYREVQTEAPINEVLAAGMILKTGWKGDTDLIDPMCGSGTILIEAAMIALNIPPGIHRKSFAFEKWPDFNRELFEEIYNDDSREKSFNHRIIGTDISPVAIDIARKNIKSAGLSPYIDLKVTSLQQYKEAPPKGIVVMNPPYGERLSSQNLFELYQMIGERMKHIFTGYEVWILSYREECFDKIGLKPAAKIKLKNGSLDCEFRKYEIFAGKRKEWKKPFPAIANEAKQSG